VSGLLSRLGARAIGQTGAVRSAARLPFAAAPTLTLEAEAPYAPAQIDPGPAAPGGSPAELTRRAAPDLPPMAAASGLAEAGAPSVSAAPRSTWAAPHPASAVIAPPPLVPVVPDQASVIRSTVAAPVRTPGEPIASHPNGSGRADAPPPVASAPGSLATPAGIALADRRPQPPGPPHPDTLAVPLLLPPQPVQPRPAWFTQAPAPDRGGMRERPPPSAETTEVQVSIGRIEVTAVHEPLPPRRPASRAPAATTLDEYLARRRGGRGGAAP
jgi:hypothetical protein